MSIEITKADAEKIFKEMDSPKPRNMNLIPFHNTVSKEVQNWSDIADEVKELKKLVLETIGGRRSFALHHSQVSREPFNFFVVHPEIVKSGLIEHDVIINPVIEKDVRNDLKADKKMVIEGCMSFLGRREKKVLRLTIVPVQYCIKTPFGFKQKNEFVSGLAAQIFQHEIEHSKGRNMYM